MKMTSEYMTEIHKLLYLNKEHDVKKIKQAALSHLKYIPQKKLYRYRKCSDREFELLKTGCIWLADPQNFPDIFDATIPMEDQQYIDFYFTFFFMFEIMYKTILEVADESTTIPSKKEMLKILHDIIENHTPEEIHNEAKSSIGEELYEKIHSSPLPEFDFSRSINEFKDILDTLYISPRNSLAITCFTTTFDNRNMWENYAEMYSGFCVEYDFSSISTHEVQNISDILCLLPVKYYRHRPLFDYRNFLHHMVQLLVKKLGLDIDTEPDIDMFLSQYYQAITAKEYDYRAENEWRLIKGHKYRGKYSFPFTTRIFIGKNISNRNRIRILDIAKELNVPVLEQTVNSEKTAYIYREINH